MECFLCKLPVLFHNDDFCAELNQFLFPTRQLYHFRDSGLWLEDYHLQRELEMLMVMMIVAFCRQKSVGKHNQFLFPQGNSTTFVTLGSGWRITIYSVNWKC